MELCTRRTVAFKLLALLAQQCFREAAGLVLWRPFIENCELVGSKLFGLPAQQCSREAGGQVVALTPVFSQSGGLSSQQKKVRFAPRLVVVPGWCY